FNRKGRILEGHAAVWTRSARSGICVDMPGRTRGSASLPSLFYVFPEPIHLLQTQGGKFQAALIRKSLHLLKPVGELPRCATQCLFRIQLFFSRKIHNGEEQIPNLLFKLRLRRRLDFAKFFMDFLQRSCRVAPIKANAGRLSLNLLRTRKGRQRLGYSVECRHSVDFLHSLYTIPLIEDRK